VPAAPRTSNLLRPALALAAAAYVEEVKRRLRERTWRRGHFLSAG